MKRVSGLIAAAFCLSSVWTARASAACQIKSFAELPVTVMHNRFLVDGVMDGKPVRFIFDSGAFGTTLFGDAARKLGLQFVGENAITGIGGEAGALVHRVAELQLGRYTHSNTRVVIAATRIGGEGVQGLLGRNEYGNFDLEFDIPHRVIRFLHAEGCSDAQMPYWAKTAYSEAPLVVLSEDISAEYRTTVTVNGRPIEMTVDSGSPLTTISTSGAVSAGLSRGDLKAVGEVRGMGAYGVTAYVGKFKTVSVDGEAVQNVELPVADLYHYTPMQKTGSLVAMENTAFAQGLLGADFLMSNRVLLSHSHQMMYFTYEGGRVFGPGAGPPPVEAKADAPPSTPSPP